MRLQPGMLIDLGDGLQALVIRSSDCSALVQPLSEKTKTITDRFTGKTVTFSAKEKTFNICSDLPAERIVGWSDGKGRS